MTAYGSGRTSSLDRFAERLTNINRLFFGIEAEDGLVF